MCGGIYLVLSSNAQSIMWRPYLVSTTQVEGHVMLEYLAQTTLVLVVPVVLVVIVAA